MEVIIIGGIAAGMSTAAKALRVNKDANITVIEKSDYISFGACGLPYYLGNEFSDENEMFARTPDQMRDAGLNLLIEHEVLSVDFENKVVTVLDLVNDKKIEKKYDKLMIATGAVEVLPNFEGVYSDNVYTITKLDSVKKLKDNLQSYNNIVIVGGGFIGIEVAEQLAHLKKDITLIQSNEYLMNGPFDPEFSDKIKEALEEIDVDVKVSERAQSFTIKDNTVTEITTDKNVYQADAVIIAIGFKPNTTFLDNQLKTLDNGAIIINEFGETSTKDVFAAGDCATVKHMFSGDQYIPLATYANKLGRLIGTNIVSDESEWLSFDKALGSSSIKVGNYEAMVTGLTEKEALSLNYNVNTTLINTVNHSNYYGTQETITIKLVYDKETFVLYGAQLFGKNETVLRGTGLTTAIYAGLTTQQIGFIDYAYAPPFASTWEAINVAANTAK